MTFVLKMPPSTFLKVMANVLCELYAIGLIYMKDNVVQRTCSQENIDRLNTIFKRRLNFSNQKPERNQIPFKVWILETLHKRCCQNNKTVNLMSEQEIIFDSNFLCNFNTCIQI